MKLLSSHTIHGQRLPGSFKTLSPIPDGATVEFLLKDDHSSWDADVVRAVFEEEVANQVL
jgi:hypothetical protein